MEIPAFAGMTFVRLRMTFVRFGIAPSLMWRYQASRLNEFECPAIRITGDGFTTDFITQFVVQSKMQV